MRAIVNNDTVWFLLDTGSPETWLDSTWALAVGAVPFPRRCRSCPTAIVDSIAIGDLRLRHHPVYLRGFAWLNKSSGRALRGIIGVELLRRYTTEIDPRERLVKLYDPRTYRDAGSGTVVPLWSDAGIPAVEARLPINGKRTVRARLLLDTGTSRVCLIFSRRFAAKRSNLFADRPSIQRMLGVGLSGPFLGRVVRLGTVRLGGFEVTAPTAGFPHDTTARVWDPPLDGVVGNPVLSGTGVVFDYARHRIIFPARGLPSDACMYDLSGLFLTTTIDTGMRPIRVAHVAEQSAASEAGILVGDEVLAIDGRTVTEIELWDVRKALSVEGPHALTLRRGSDSVSVSLALHRPI